eukprot:329889-Prymnesium_polylepis.1
MIAARIGAGTPGTRVPVRSMEKTTSPWHSGQDGVKLVPMSTTFAKHPRQTWWLEPHARTGSSST